MSNVLLNEENEGFRWSAEVELKMQQLRAGGRRLAHVGQIALGLTPSVALDVRTNELCKYPTASVRLYGSYYSYRKN